VRKGRGSYGEEGTISGLWISTGVGYPKKLQHTNRRCRLEL